LLINERRIHVLHPCATALRHLRNGSRNSRNFFVAMCGATMLAALAACGSDNSTSPRTLATITLTPENPTIVAGGTQQFTAVGKDASGNVISISPTWSVAAGGGTIDDNGLFTAGSTLGTFTNTVTAKSGSITGTASVEVTSSALATIAITPANPTLAAGATQQFTAVGKDANGNVVPISPTWSVASGGGTIDENGLFTAGSTAGAFTNTVTATSGSVTATASVTVTSPAPSVVGDYALQSVDGKAPPDTVVNTPSAVIVFLDGALSLHSDASYKLLFHTTTKTSSGTVADSSGTIGTYAVNGSTVVLHSSPTDSVVATSSPSSITFTAGGEVFIFSK
jgi:hypothetical protein